MTDEKQIQEKANPDTTLVKYAVLFFGAVLIILGTLFASYRYSQTFSSNIILPNGVTYTGPTTTK
jgi:hypothetical protein